MAALNVRDALRFSSTACLRWLAGAPTTGDPSFWFLGHWLSLQRVFLGRRHSLGTRLMLPGRFLYTMVSALLVQDFPRGRRNTTDFLPVPMSYRTDHRSLPTSPGNVARPANHR